VFPSDPLEMGLAQGTLSHTLSFGSRYIYISESQMRKSFLRQGAV